MKRSQEQKIENTPIFSKKKLNFLSHRNNESDRQRLFRQTQNEIIEKRLSFNVSSLDKANSHSQKSKGESLKSKYQLAKQNLQRVKSINSLDHSVSRGKILKQIREKLIQKEKFASKTKDKYKPKLSHIRMRIKTNQEDQELVNNRKKIMKDTNMQTQESSIDGEKFNILLKEFDELKKQLREMKHQNQELLKNLDISKKLQRRNFSIFDPQENSSSNQTNLDSTEKKTPQMHEYIFSNSSSFKKKKEDSGMPCFSCGCDCRIKTDT